MMPMYRRVSILRLSGLQELLAAAGATCQRRHCLDVLGGWMPVAPLNMILACSTSPTCSG